MNPQEPMQPPQPQQPGMPPAGAFNPVVGQAPLPAPAQPVPQNFIQPQSFQPQQPNPQPAMPAAPMQPAPQVFNPVQGMPMQPQPAQQMPQQVFGQPVSGQPYQAPNQSGGKKKILRVFGGIFVALLVLAGIGLRAAGSLASSTPSYKEFTTYTNQKAESGSKFSFDAPKQFTTESEYAGSVEMSHKIPEDVKKKSSIGDRYAQLHADYTFAGTEAMAIIVKQFDDKSSEIRKGFDDNLKDSFKNDKNVVLGDLSAQSDIDGHKAYLMTYSYDQDDGVHVKGTVLVVFGKNGVYTFEMNGIDSVWDKNTAAWARINKSFKVDL